jgi:hypothetical protein
MSTAVPNMKHMQDMTPHAPLIIHPGISIAVNPQRTFKPAAIAARRIKYKIMVHHSKKNEPQ